MPHLTIPERYRPGISLILKLPAQGLVSLVTVLSTAPPSPNAEGILNAIAGKVEGIGDLDLREIAVALFSLYVVRAQSEESVETFVSDVIEAVMEVGIEPSTISSDRREAIRLNLSRLLDIEPLNLVSKAIGLRFEHPRTYCTSKILTDLRPVFSSDASTRLVGGVIVHNLKLNYHEAGEYREFFVVMDSDDIKTLAGVLDRAVAKEARLKAVFDAAGISDLSNIKD